MIQTNSQAGAMFQRLALSPANFEVKLPAPKGSLETSRKE